MQRHDARYFINQFFHGREAFLVVGEELTIICSITQHDQRERITVLVGLIRSHPRLYSTHLLENKSYVSMINLFWFIRIVYIVFSNANKDWSNFKFICVALDVALTI